jgi:hypothetical protein
MNIASPAAVGCGSSLFANREQRIRKAAVNLGALQRHINLQTLAAAKAMLSQRWKLAQVTACPEPLN